MQHLLDTHEFDALSVLMSDQVVIKQLFHDYEQLLAHKNDHARKLIVEQICMVLHAHISIQEEILYPALQSVFGCNVLIKHAMVDHLGVRELCAKLKKMQPMDDDYDATVAVLNDYVKPYINSDQEELFTKIRGNGIDTKALGLQMAQRQKGLYGAVPLTATSGLTAYLAIKPFAA